MMVRASFKSGEIVALKSGGPNMTVSEDNGDWVYCQWFSGKKLEKGHFKPDTLVRVPDGSKTPEAK